MKLVKIFGTTNPIGVSPYDIFIHPKKVVAVVASEDPNYKTKIIMVDGTDVYTDEFSAVVARLVEDGLR